MAPHKEIHSIVKASEVMKCLSAGENKLSSIARMLGYDKSTTHRILKTLEKVGFAIQDVVSKRFYPGPLLHSLSANSLKAHQVLNEIALKHMKDLRDSIEETVNLQIAMGSHRIIVEIVFMIREYMYFAKSGDTSPIHSGAAGKALLSMLDRNDLMSLLNKTIFAPSPNDINGGKDALIQDVNKAILQGHAIEFYSNPINGGAFSVPIENYVSPVALTVVGIEERLKKNRNEILKSLKIASKKISDELSAVYG